MNGIDRDRVQAYRELIADVYELAGRSRRSSDAFARSFGQTVARWHVLSVVRTEPLTVPRIADRLGVTRQSVQRVVDDLDAAHLVEISPNPGHRRSPQVHSTNAGAAVCDELFESSAPGRAAMLAAGDVSAEDLRHAQATLRRILVHFEDGMTQTQAP